MWNRTLLDLCHLGETGWCQSLNRANAIGSLTRAKILPVYIYIYIYIYIYGIVSLIASEQFAKNPPPRRIGKPSNMVRNIVSGYLDNWIAGYVDIWISGFWSKQWVDASSIRTSVWCSPAVFFSREKTGSWCFCNLKLCFLHSAKTIFNGTRLDRRGLKS